MRRYTVLLIPRADEPGYEVMVPALPGCYSQGRSRDEALANIREAMVLHLKNTIADGEPLPDERAAPELVAVDVEERLPA